MAPFLIHRLSEWKDKNRLGFLRSSVGRGGWTEGGGDWVEVIP